jgi:hypothetical protein
MLCIGVNKIKIHFDTSQLCCGVVHKKSSRRQTGELCSNWPEISIPAQKRNLDNKTCFDYSESYCLC